MPFDKDAKPFPVLIWRDGRFVAPEGMSEEEFAVHKRRTEAIQHYEETGDPSLAIAAGLFPPEVDERTTPYHSSSPSVTKYHMYVCPYGETIRDSNLRLGNGGKSLCTWCRLVAWGRGELPPDEESPYDD